MEQLKPIQFNRFANGVVSSVNPNSQPVASIPHAINFLFDEELDSAVTRTGLTGIGSQTQNNPILGLHNHNGTNSFALAVVSNGANNVIYKSTGGSWSSSLATDTKDLQTSFAQFLDTTIRVNGTNDPVSTTDATTWATTGGNLNVGQLVSSGIKGDIVKVYKQRLQVIDNSTVYISSVPLDFLDYDGQTANFTVGNTLRGATSGATAIIVNDSDSGTTGTLILANVKGIFINNETISETDATGTPGSATANGGSSRKISWQYGNKENIQVDPQNGSDIIGVGTVGGVEGIEIFFKTNGAYRYNGSFLDAKPFTTLGCTSTNSVVEFSGGIGFANKYGYCFTNGNDAKIITTPVRDWWDNIAAAFLDNISAFANDRYLLICIGDITKKDVLGKSKTYNNVVLRKSLTSDAWSVLSFSKEFTQFVEYKTSTGDYQTWGGTTDGYIYQLFAGTSDSSTPIQYELDFPQIIGDSIYSKKNISEYVGLYGKGTKGIKLYCSLDENKFEDVGSCEEVINKVQLGEEIEGNVIRFKLANYQIGAPVTIRDFTIPYIDTDGHGGAIGITDRYKK